MTPLWMRVRMNVAQRLPTNVVQRSRIKHTGKTMAMRQSNLGQPSIQCGGDIDSEAHDNLSTQVRQIRCNMCIYVAMVSTRCCNGKNQALPCAAVLRNQMLQ